MSIDYSEKRDFMRMNTDSTMTIKPQDSNEVHRGICRNLSASGVFFTTDQRFDPGTLLHINITPEKTVVPPLDAIIEVVRTQADSQSGYGIAAQIKRID